MKIIVKLQLEPEIKEIYEGNDLSALRFGSEHPILVVKDGDETLGEFMHWAYWVKEGIKGQMGEVLRDREILLKEIEKFTSTDPTIVATALQRLKKIREMISEKDALSDEIILEPNEAALLLNLKYLDSFINKLGPGMPEETLRWAIYSVIQYVENKMIPGGPCDPNAADWSWEQFKDSFRKLEGS